MQDKKIVYTDGVFDLFHVGHIRMFKKALAFGNFLIAGVISDKDCESYKRTPVVDEKSRAEMIMHCRLVDRVIENAPLVLTKEFILENKIDIVVHGDDSAQTDFFKVPIEMGIMRYVPYDKTTSTTSIIKSLK
jgi:cytidyltransferase-like protein